MTSDPIARLYARVGHLVVRRCAQMLRDPEEAADVAQWVFVRAIEVGFEPRSDAESLAWLYRTATQRCLHVLRSHRTRAHLRVVHDAALRPSGFADVEGVLGDREVLAQLLGQVDDRTAEVALATYGMGLTTERVSELLGVSVRTVGRARAAFDEVVKRWRAAEAS